VKKVFSVALGIMTALGGFVDLGQIVFTTQAGSLFGYRHLWAIVLGTVAIIVYMEMCGRIAVVAREPVFAIVRDRLGFKLGLVTLVASNLLNLVTCAAELGGIAIVLRLLTGWPEKPLLIGATLLLGTLVLLLRFQWIERTIGLAGLMMIVFAVSALVLGPGWYGMRDGLVPTIPFDDKKSTLLYAYFAVGIFSAMLMEYEVHFYSSGALEENWKEEDLGENFMVASLGSVLGAVLTVALLVLGAIVCRPRGMFPNLLSSAPMLGALPFGQKALLLAALGILACVTGAAVETALSGGYNVCQFFNLTWGKNLGIKKAPEFTASWISMFVLALIFAATGIRPLTLVNISIVFGMVVLPFTYFPILRTAADKNVMGKHANGKFMNVVATILFVLIVIAAVAAIPLTLLTRSGTP